MGPHPSASLPSDPYVPPLLTLAPTCSPLWPLHTPAPFWSPHAPCHPLWPLCAPPPLWAPHTPTHLHSGPLAPCHPLWPLCTPTPTLTPACPPATTLAPTHLLYSPLTSRFGGPSVQFKSKTMNFRALILYFFKKFSALLYSP